MRAPTLLVRDGARYACFSDGLCCTDAHALGPVMPAETMRLTVLRTQPTRHHEALDIEVLDTHAHRCGFLRDDGLCRVHAELSAETKPHTCQQFPFGFVTTPQGTRITTEHRCPCRSLGERPLLQASDAAHLHVHDDENELIDDEIDLDTNNRVVFGEYARIESELIARLLSGEEASVVIDAAPFPALDGLSWTDVAHLYRSLLDGSICGDALATFGDVILGMVSSYRPRRRARTWANAFDRAEARTEALGDPKFLLNDFIADQLWNLAWADATFAQARAELATRAAIATSFADSLAQEGVRADRAMAEAILVVELGGASALWQKLRRQMVTP